MPWEAPKTDERAPRMSVVTSTKIDAELSCDLCVEALRRIPKAESHVDIEREARDMSSSAEVRRLDVVLWIVVSKPSVVMRFMRWSAGSPMSLWHSRPGPP